MYILSGNKLLRRLTMQKGSYGQIVLSIYSYTDGCITAYGLSNVKVPDHVMDFKRLYDMMLTDYIENQSWIAKNFLDLCVDNYEKIVNSDYSFITAEYKMK